MRFVVVPDIDDSFVVVCLVAAFYFKDYFHFNFLLLENRNGKWEMEKYKLNIYKKHLNF